MKEIEIKLKVEGFNKYKNILLKNGFKIILKNTFERNLIFDTNNNELKNKKYLLRLRKEENKTILTFKKPINSIKDEYKKKEEIEVEVSDFEKAKTILFNLGFEIKFIYEKYREIYKKDNTLVMFDKTPIGNYIEIEGEPDDIDKTAILLGFKKDDYINKTYRYLFSETKRKGDMIFDS